MEKHTPLPPLLIKDADLSARIEFNSKKNELNLKGHTVPANAHIFFTPMFEWVHEFLKSKPTGLSINIAFEYLHTGAARQVFDLLKLMKNYDVNGTMLTVNWYSEEDDDDMKQVGIDFSAALSREFNFITLSN